MRADRRTLLFRVAHHRRRVSLEVFHALSDGTGALWFLTALLEEYCRRRFAPEDTVDAAGSVEPEVHELAADSFAHHFRRRTRAERAARAREELAALEVLGLRPVALVLNRLIDVDDRFALDLPHPAVRLVRSRVAGQDDAREALAEVSTVLDRPVIEAAEAADPVLTPAAAAAVSWDADAILDAEPAVVPVPDVRPTGGAGLDARYEWSVALPLVDPTTIGLGRVEEDVVVEAQGVRRRIRLPSVLRRCVVAGATYEEGELRVSFVPDPEVWPRG